MEDHDHDHGDKVHARKAVQHATFDALTQANDQHVPHQPEQPEQPEQSPSSPHQRRHHQEQLQQLQLHPWLIPHPNLSISWHNNDNTHAMSLADQQGHESDPSELLRPPVLFRGNHHDRLPRFLNSTSPNEQDLFAFTQPRTRRSMSLSLASRPPWPSAGDASIPSSPDLNRTNEIVPYSQEWRVILRSPPRGRTVLYNPEMQSLVVQTTIGRNSHSGMPLSMEEESNRPICALCRRPLDSDTPVDEEHAASFMDSNYFRLLSEANQALSRRSTLRAPLRPPPSTNSPTSSSRASLDLDGGDVVSETDDQHGLSSSSSLHGLGQDRHHHAPHLSHNALNQGYYERFFLEQDKLGKGFRGSVFLCQHILDGVFLGEYAIKKVAIGDNHDWLVQMLREVHLLERLHHPNIISYKHAWLENHRLTKFGPEVACLFILMECANGGNLEEYIESPPEQQGVNADGGRANNASSSQGLSTNAGDGGNSSSMPGAKRTISARERILQERRKQAQAAAAAASSPPSDGTASKSQSTPQRYLPISEVWSFFFDICEGLAHLHRLGIIHRDLKPPNLLLSYSDNRVKGTKGERPRLVISDFGECEVLDQAAKRDRTGATGTLEFLAPELLQVDEEGRYMNEFSFKGDMWSLGMILYYLCYSRLPYSQIDDVDLLKEEIRGFRSISLPPDGPGDRIIPEELKILIKMLLSTDKSKRPSCDEILMTLAPQRERMARGGNGNGNGSSSGRADPSSTAAMAASSNSIPQYDLPVFSASMATSSAMPSTSSAALRVSALTRRQSSSSGHNGKNQQDHRLHHTQQHYHVGSGGVNRVPGIRAPGKRVKPLGLGLRHMLRRRMMHYPYPPEGYHYLAETAVERGAESANEARPQSLRFSERYPPSLSRQSRGSTTTTRSTLGDTVVSAAVVGEDDGTLMCQDEDDEADHSMDLDTQVPLDLTTPFEDDGRQRQHSRAAKDDVRGDLLLPGHEDRNGTKSRQRSSEGRDRGEGYRLNAKAGSRQSLNKGSPPRPSAITYTTSSGKADRDMRVGISSMTEPHTPASPSSSYWSHLADHHSRHPSRGQNAIAPRSVSKKALKKMPNGSGGGGSGHLADDSDSSGSDEDDSNHDESWKTDSVAAGVGSSRADAPSTFENPSLLRQRHRRRRRAPHNGAVANRMAEGGSMNWPGSENAAEEHGLEGDKEEGGEDDELEPISRDRRSFDVATSSRAISKHNRRSSFRNDANEFQDVGGQRHNRRSLLQGPTSTVITFVSLLARIWFCQRICYPVTVRPLVLYPILALTMVWDRYLLAILMEGEERRHKTRHDGETKRVTRRRPSHQFHLSPSPALARFGQETSDEANITEEERKAVARPPEVDGGTGEEQVDDSNLAGASNAMMMTTTIIGSFEDAQQRALVPSLHPQQKGPDSERHPRLLPLMPSAFSPPLAETQSLFWAALAMGLGVQLLWVAIVWIFSRGRLCAAP